MTRSKTNILEQFLTLFNAVRDAASYEPARLTAFYKEHQQLKSAVNQLYAFMSFGDFERRVFHSSKKYHPQAPRNFEKAFTDYKDNWELQISECVFPLLLDLLDLDIGDGTNDDDHPSILPEVHAPDPKYDDRFDPLAHDGGKAIPMAFWVTENYALGVDDELADTVHYASKIGLEAYDYLTGTIGLNVDSVFRRWRSIPIIFMPVHVSNAHGFTERGSLFDLIDDAVRAFVFGAPAAAIATCRAGLEMILKRHYDLDYKFEDRDGRARDKGLGELIILADEKYAFVQGRRLERLSLSANRIMHNYSAQVRMSDSDERTILDFLKTIKFMIERAPLL